MRWLEQHDAENREKHQMDRIECLLRTLITIGEIVMADLTALQTAVTNEDTVADSVLALVKGMAAQIAALPVSQAAIDALAADINAKATAMAAAVTANTPAAPPVTGTKSV